MGYLKHHYLQCRGYLIYIGHYKCYWRLLWPLIEIAITDDNHAYFCVQQNTVSILTYNLTPSPSN